MVGKKRCFVSVRALRRLNENLLCEVLKKFPGYLHECGLKLPDPPDRETLDYEAIQEACMSGDIPPDLDDVLFFVSILGNKRGQAQIEKEAGHRGRRLDFRLDGLSYPDFAMRAWLHDWPANRNLLEAAYARTRIFGKCAYTHNPMIRDVRSLFQEPTPERMAEARAALEDYFANREGLGRGTNILLYDLSPSLFFLVRYPGQIERHQAVDEDGNPCSHVFRPEEYDAIIYHKEHGDLRLNTNRERDHRIYRITFGHLLFGQANVFDPNENTVRLDPLLGRCGDLFNCQDIDGLAEIHPVEVVFTDTAHPCCRMTMTADKDLTLLSYCPGPVLPPTAQEVLSAKFIYRLSNRAKWERITVHRGQSLCYERDGNCAPIENWLRRRGFVTNPIERKPR